MTKKKKPTIDYAKLQAAADEMELHTEEFTEVIPDDEIARLVGSDLRETLEAIRNAGPVLGTEAAWDAECDLFIQNNWAIFLAVATVTGPDRGLRFVSDGSVAANRRIAATWSAMRPLGRQGAVWGRAIEETLKANPDLSGAIAAFRGSWLGAGCATRSADGLRHVANAEYDTAVVLLALQVEAMLREWAKFYGADVRGKGPRSLMLGGLIADAKDRLPSEWWLQIQVIVGPDLYNLRNEAAHSRAPFKIVEVGLILQILTYLASIQKPAK